MESIWHWDFYDLKIRKVRQWKDHRIPMARYSTRTKPWREVAKFSVLRSTRRVSNSLFPNNFRPKTPWKFPSMINSWKTKYSTELKQLSSGELTGVLGEMESLVAALSETLIAELALRDELEFEKELKNQFISLLLAVQHRRRQHHVTKKRGPMQNGTSPLPQHRSFQDSKVTAQKTFTPSLVLFFMNSTTQWHSTWIFSLLQYLTTVIPYHTDNGPPNNQALQVLIKSTYSFRSW